MARGGGGGGGRRRHARALAGAGALRLAARSGRAPGLGAAADARRPAGIPDGRHAASPAARAATPGRRGGASDRPALRRQHRGRRAGHAGDALPARARLRHHAVGGRGRPARPGRGRVRSRARSPHAGHRCLRLRTARGAAVQGRPTRPRPLRHRRRRRAGLRGRLGGAARAVPEHARARLRGHARDVPVRARTGWVPVRALESADAAVARLRSAARRSRPRPGCPRREAASHATSARWRP